MGAREPGTGGVVTVYESEADGQWYWRQTAANGEQIADGGEGYLNAADCLAMAEVFARRMDARLVMVDRNGDEVDITGG